VGKIKFLLAGLLISQIVFSQTLKDSIKPWKLSSLYTLTGTQNSFVNWNAGGRNNIALLGSVNANANYNKNRLKWNNDLTIAFGGIRYLDKKAALREQKTDDRFDFLSSFGYEFQKKLFLTFVCGLKTQMAPGFVYPNDSVKVSSFMAPGYMNFALGIEYAKNDNFKVLVSPLSSKTTYVLDDSLSNVGAFGVSPGEKVRNEFGSYIKIRYNQKLAKNIELRSLWEFFSNYLNNPQNIDINAELMILMRVNSLISTSLQWNLIYDDDVKIRDVNGNVGPRTQFKSVLGVGLSYKLDNQKKK
jgi:hypothetical protein